MMTLTTWEKESLNNIIKIIEEEINKNKNMHIDDFDPINIIDELNDKILFMRYELNK